MNYDIICVGAGPAGLSTAIEAKKNGLSCLVIDKGSIANTIRRYPTYAVFFSTSELLEIDDIPFPSLNKQPTRQEAMNYYTKVALKKKISFQLYTEVQTIDKVGDNFFVNTDKGEFRANQVVMAIGYFEKFNQLNVKGEEQEHVQHYYTESYPHIGRNVVVIGGSNSAAEAALDLYRAGANVTLIHRGERLRQKIKYWVKPDIENRIREGSIKGYMESEVLEIASNSLHLRKNSTGEEFTIDSDHVFALIGFHPDTSLLKNSGIQVDETTLVPVFNEETLESNIDGLYLAGTVLTGRFTSKIFIENSRHHGKLIVNDIVRKYQEQPVH